MNALCIVEDSNHCFSRLSLPVQGGRGRLSWSGLC